MPGRSADVTDPNGAIEWCWSAAGPERRTSLTLERRLADGGAAGYGRQLCRW